MKTSQRGLDLIKLFEGLELEAYLDAVDVWTIGYGHTSRAGPPDVTPGMVITEEEAESILRNDLRKFEDDVEGAVRVDITQNMFDALVSITYNIGPTNMRRSTFMRRLNQEDYEGAADALLMWNKAGGRVLRGLQRRRAAERELFLDGYDPDLEMEPEDTRGLPVEEDAQRRENLLTSRTMGGAAATGGAGAAAIGATMMGNDDEADQPDDDATGEDQAPDDTASTEDTTDGPTNDPGPDTGAEDDAATDDPTPVDDATDAEDAPSDDTAGDDIPADDTPTEDDSVAADDDSPAEEDNTEEPIDQDSSGGADSTDTPVEPEDTSGRDNDAPTDDADTGGSEPPADDTPDPEEPSSNTDDELIEGTEQYDGPLFVHAFEAGEATDAVVLGAGTVAVLSAIWVAAVRFDDWRNHRR